MRPVFVGREAELVVLAEAATHAAAGQSRCAIVGGEAGMMGKSRLVAEALAAAERRASGCSRQCVELGADGMALGPLVEAAAVVHRLGLVPFAGTCAGR
jgi:predicted ATPase